MPFVKGQPNPKSWPKGVSGNPKGRPKGAGHTIRSLAKSHRKEIVDILLKLAKSDEDGSVRLGACRLLAEYSDGKPRAEVAEDEFDGPRDVDSMSDEELEARSLNGHGGDAA